MRGKFRSTYEGHFFLSTYKRCFYAHKSKIRVNKKKKESRVVPSRGPQLLEGLHIGCDEFQNCSQGPFSNDIVPVNRIRYLSADKRKS